MKNQKYIIMKKSLLLITAIFFGIIQFISAQFDANSFKARFDIGSMPFRPGSLAVSDFTADGLPDFAVGGEWNREISIFTNQSIAGNLAFQSFTSFPTNFSDNTKTNGVFNNSLKIVDMNADGLKDIVMSGYWNGGSIDGVGPNQPGIINIYLNKGTASAPSFSDVADKSLLANDYDNNNDGNVYIDVADINGDGKPDIAAKRTWSGGHTAFLNISQGGVLSFNQGIPINGGRSAWKDGIRIADMDGDGANDIIGLDEYQVWIAKNTNNTFPAQSVQYDVAAPKYMDVADIDNDGDMDYIVVSANNLILGVNDRNQADLASRFPQTFIDNAGSGELSLLAIGDLDKDGKLDLAVTQSNGSDVAGTLQLYKNTSSGNNVSFAGFAGYKVLKDPGAVRIADFDGDGKLDIIVHHFLQGQDSVSIFLNNLDIPSVTAITSAGAGEQTVISGYGFTGATKVIFSGKTANEVLAADFTVDAEGKTITLLVPAGAKTGKIKIQNTTGIYFQDPVFTFIRPVPVIDGVADAMWNNFPIEYITHMVSNYTVEYDSVDLSGSFKAYWDADALYILGKVKDDLLIPPVPSSASDYNNDYFEVYIDGDNSKNRLPEGAGWDKTAYDNNDSQIRFVYQTDSVSGGAGWLPNHQAAKDLVEVKEVTEADNLSYTIEMRIPWTAIGDTIINPKPGMKIGFDVQLGDNDGVGRDREMAWKTYSDDVYHNPALFGTFELLEDGTLLSHNDNEKPSAITGLSSKVTGNTITLLWNASTDNFGVYAYKIFDATGKQILSTTDTTVTFSKLKFNTTYAYLVVAEDAAYNQSEGAGIEVQTLPDTQAPSIPQNFTAVATGLSVKLSWAASTDNDKVVSYKIYLDGTLIKTSTSLSFTVTVPSADKIYTFSIRATDPSGNASDAAIAVIDFTTSLNERAISEFSVFPNPATSTVVVSASFPFASVKVMNTCGQTLLREDKINVSHYELNLSGMPSGIYFIKVSNLDGSETVKKIIKK